MYLGMNSVEFTDLLVLHAIMEYTSTHGGKPPSSAVLIRQVNQQIGEKDIGLDYANRLSSNGVLSRRIRKLRGAGLMANEGHPLRQRHILLPVAKDLIKALDADWRKWPLAIPIIEGKTRLDLAKYHP